MLDNTSHHPHDRRWIQEQLKRLPHHLRGRALDGYDRVHRETLAANAGHVDAEGFARREANKRLREYIDKINT
jgi:hypothetical protein